jgi:hypothetical protein
VPRTLARSQLSGQRLVPLAVRLADALVVVFAVRPADALVVVFAVAPCFTCRFGEYPKRRRDGLAVDVVSRIDNEVCA